MSVSSEIFSKVTDYTERRADLRELESWLAGLVELCLAELHAGLRTERSVKTRLSRYMTSKPDPVHSSPSGGSDLGEEAV